MSQCANASPPKAHGNPLALNEITFPSAFLSSLGTYTDQASLAALIDQSIDQTLASQEVSINGDEIDLTDAHLFPNGTTYTPTSDEIQYEDEVEAGIAAAPEPGAMALSLMIAGALSLPRRRKEKRTSLVL